jgi:hypothetical protein
MEMGERVLKVKPWAEITIDGRVLGRALLRTFSVGPGPHTLVISHPGLGIAQADPDDPAQVACPQDPELGAPDRKVQS